MTTKPRTVNDQIRAILAEAERLTGVPLDRIAGHSRRRGDVRVRKAVYLAIRRLPEAPSLPEIGEALDRDHSTILSGIRSAEALEQASAWFAWLVHDLEALAFRREFPPAKPRPAGVPCVTTGCRGRMVPPRMFPHGRSQCPICERYEPRGQAARDLRVA